MVNLISPDLDPDVIHLWIADRSTWSSSITSLMKLLTKHEIQRHSRLKIDEKKDQFLKSRGLLRLVLSSYLGLSPGLIQFETNPAGKPYLMDSDLSFNLSHSGDLFIYGFCLKAQIGVDIQEIYSISSMESVIKKTISPKEQSYFEGLSTGKSLQAFFNIWTAKESYLKAQGEGFQANPAAISVIPELSGSNFTLEDQSNNEKGSEWTIQSIRVQPGYKAAFAVNKKVSRVDLNHLHPSLFVDYI